MANPQQQHQNHTAPPPPGQHDPELHDLLVSLAKLLDLPLARVCQAFIAGFGVQVMEELDEWPKDGRS